MANTTRFLALVILLTAACGDDDGPGPGTIDGGGVTIDSGGGGPDASADAGPTPTGLDAICNPTDGFLQQLHAKYVECAGFPPTGFVTQFSVPLVPILLGAGDLSAACYGVSDYLADGTIVLGDAAAFAACDAYLAALTCENWSLANPCTALVRGTIPAGQPCYQGDTMACAPGNFCSQAAGMVGAACYTCAPKLADGQACNGHPEVCASGECANGLCGAPSVLPGAACSSDGECKGVYFCLVNNDSSYTCQKNPTTAVAGDRCDGRDNECAPAQTGLGCKNTAQPGFPPSYQCQPYAAAAAACNPFQNKCNPFDGQECIGGTCQAAQPGAAAGASCSSENPCGAGLRCNTQFGGFAAGSCVTVLAEGEMCSVQDVFCAPGALCASVANGVPAVCRYSRAEQTMCKAGR